MESEPKMTFLVSSCGVTNNTAKAIIIRETHNYLQEKYNIAAFFSGVGGIELGFEQTNEYDRYGCQSDCLNDSNLYFDNRETLSAPMYVVT